jgi:D-beta-D-heptose 7-phosphate kinase/D-beta-D-heptose 1-phosphate adenosyltransferase
MAVITLDASGMALARADGTGKIFAAKARSVYDITGAGDMVLAMLALGFGARLPAETSVQLANVAAGLEVDRTGVTALTREEIRAELNVHPRQSLRKQLTNEQAARLAGEYRRRGKSIVFTNGCFDLLHVGHVTYLEEAASHGDVLIVGVNSDQSVRRLKGPQRPIVGETDRAMMLASLGCVDHVVLFDEDTPHSLLAEIRPDVLVKGGDYAPHEVVGHEIVEAQGGRVEVTGIVPDVSTTQIVESVRQRSDLRKAG